MTLILCALLATLDLGPKGLNYGVGIRVGGGYTDSTPSSGLTRRHRISWSPYCNSRT